MPITITSLDKALHETRKLLESLADLLEYTPKEAGSDGPIPKHVIWQSVRRDLSDLPRGVRVLIRKRGTKVKAFVPVCLPMEDSTILARYTPEDLEIRRSLDAERWQAMDEMAKVLDYKRTSLDEIAALQVESMEVVRKGIDHANTANVNAELITQLVAQQAELQDAIADADSKQEIVRSVKLYVDKILDTVKLHSAIKKTKGMPEMMAIPQFEKEYKEFLEWRREKAFNAAEPGTVADDDSDAKPNKKTRRPPSAK